MKQRMTLTNLKSSQDSVSQGRKRPFDFYDTDQPSLLARVGKTTCTFYCYLSRTNKQKLASKSAHELDNSELKHLRRVCRDISGQYRELDALTFDDSTPRHYLRYVYKHVVSSKVYDEIDRLPDFILETPINILRPHEIERWKSLRLKNGIAQDTLRKQYYALSGMLNYALRHGHISHHHIKGVKFIIDKQSTIAKAYTPDQLERLRTVLKSCSLRDQCVVLLTLLSGSRPKESLSIRIHDLDFDRSQIWLRSSTTKGQIARYVKMPPVLSKKISEYLDNEWVDNSQGWLFYNPKTNDRLMSFRKQWETIANAAMLKGVRFYDLRHTFCSMMIKEGSLPVVQKLMGHRQIGTTAKYLHHFADEEDIAASSLQDRMGFNDF